MYRFASACALSVPGHENGDGDAIQAHHGSMDKTIRLEVEQRPFALGADGGPCLRVRDSEGREWLRFDCFRFEQTSTNGKPFQPYTGTATRVFSGGYAIFLFWTVIWGTHATGFDDALLLQNSSPGSRGSPVTIRGMVYGRNRIGCFLETIM